MSSQQSAVSLINPAKIPGNASLTAKANIASVLNDTKVDKPGFMLSVLRRMAVTDVSIVPKAEEPQKLESRVVCEMIVEEDMCNPYGHIHGGCSAFLIDVCSTLAILAYGRAGNDGVVYTVSQAIDVVCHSPALLGDKIRIINTTLTVGGRTMSARTEIWNVTSSRLVSTGTHIKMFPSPSPAKL